MPAHGSRPLLIYDGDCGFCVYWARYWQKLTGDRVDYRPYQQVAAQYPEISEAEFQRAVQYIAPDGTRASAAEASFLTLSHAPGKGFWLALYKHVPGFAPVSEWAYAFIAAHRSAFYRISLLLWGKDHEPPRYDLVSFLFLRLLGLVYLTAFVSFAVQAQGLIGSYGILPLAQFTDAVAERFGAERYYLVPMVFWLNDSDAAIQAVCWAGAGLSLLLVVNVLPRLCLFLLFALYLSLFYAGQIFMSYQWDLFLLEMGFAALLLSFATTPGHLSAALADVPLHVHVGRGQAPERRSQLVEPVGARRITFSPSRCPRRSPGTPRRCRQACWRSPPAQCSSSSWFCPSSSSPRADCGSSRPSASCCSRSASSSPATTTGSIFRPCCFACRCSTTRRCGRYCPLAWPS